MHSAELLTKDEELDNCHKEAASEGQTAAPSVDEKTNLHFVCFVCKVFLPISAS